MTDKERLEVLVHRFLQICFNNLIDKESKRKLLYKIVFSHKSPHGTVYYYSINKTDHDIELICVWYKYTKEVLINNVQFYMYECSSVALLPKEYVVIEIDENNFESFVFKTI